MGSITAAVVVIALHDDIIMYSLSRDRVGRNLKTARVRRFESADTAYNIILFCARGPGQDDRTEGRKRGREGVEEGGEEESSEYTRVLLSIYVNPYAACPILTQRRDSFDDGCVREDPFHTWAIITLSHYTCFAGR